MTGSDFPLNQLLAQFLGFLPRLGLGVLVFAIAYALSIWTNRLIKRGLERRKADRQLIVLLEILTRTGILALGLVAALEQIAPGRFGSLIAGLGIAGFTIGFALQDVAKNFVAGILLLLQKPFEIGEAIEVGGYGGTVVDISLRSTELQTWDGRDVLIPNGDVFVGAIVNFSRAVTRRIELSIPIPYEADLDAVTRTGLETLASLPGVIDHPAPQLAFTAFDDRAIRLTAYFWIKTGDTDLLEAKDRGVKALRRAFHSLGIELPLPSQTIDINRG
jgi:small conductance mechanosensitive channel